MIPTLSFREGAGDVVVNLPMLLDTRALIQGSSRSGKTHTLFYILEQVYGRVLSWVVDREADFVVLREKFDYVIVGGEDGDIPFDLTSKRGFETLVRKLLELRLNTIFDVSEMDEDTRAVVVARLCNELADLHRNSGLWQHMLLLIDELQHYAPEKGAGEATRAISKLSSVGGKRGFCLVGATQALAEVNKSAVRMLENKLILRTGSVDAERAARELRMKSGDIVAELRALERGVGYAYGPAIALDPILVQVPGELQVYPPKRGEMRPPAPPPPDAIRTLLAQLPDATAAAEAEAQSLEDARAEIDRLRGELRRAHRGSPSSGSEVAKLEVTIIEMERDREAAIASYKRTAEDHNERIAEFSLRLEQQASDLLALVRSIPRGIRFDDSVPVPGTAAAAPSTPRKADVAQPTAPAVSVRTPRRSGAATAPTPPPEGLTEAQARILAALATLHALGVSAPTRPAVGTLSGYSDTSGGTFASNVRVLIGQWLVEIPAPGALRLTDAGRRVAPAAEKIRSLAQFHDKWMSLLDAGEARILAALIAVYPESLTRPELGKRSGYTDTSGGTFASNVRKLIEMRAAEIPAKKSVRASNLLFPKSLR